MPIVSALLRSEMGDAVLDPTAASKEIHIALRRDGQVGSGSARGPFDGSTAARFDAVMAALGDNVALRLGPGTFPTQGEKGWAVKNGLKVIGSGMFATCLKLSLASADANSQYHVVGSSVPPAMNGFELSDLTIDCNLAGQPDTGAGFPQIMAGGVDLRGPNMVIRRVRVINFGTNTKSWECFGIGIAYAEASDTPVASNFVIEDCVIERPALANARETTCLNLSAFENDKLQAALVEAFARLAQRSENVHLYLLMNPCDVGHNLVTLLRRHRLEGKADISSPDLNLSQALADADLNRLYNPFDVMALPTMGEGFGLPIIESLAAGVPVVATDCSACTELVQGRGALVRPIAKLTMGTNLIEQAIIDVEDLAEQLGQLQQDPEKRQRYAVAGQAFAGTLDWDELMPQWLEVIGLAAGPQI